MLCNDAVQQQLTPNQQNQSAPHGTTITYHIASTTLEQLAKQHLLQTTSQTIACTNTPFAYARLRRHPHTHTHTHTRTTTHNMPFHDRLSKTVPCHHSHDKSTGNLSMSLSICGPSEQGLHSTSTAPPSSSGPISPPPGAEKEGSLTRKQRCTGPRHMGKLRGNSCLSQQRFHLVATSFAS